MIVPVNFLLYMILQIFAAVAASTKEECNNAKCPGPLQFYRDMLCTPVYKNSDDCCAIRYECNYLKKLSPEKCYVNGHQYSVGERLRKEDELCDTACKCVRTVQGDAAITCTYYAYYLPVDEGCYRPRNATDCYPGPQICPKTPEERPKCVVDETLYFAGEKFRPMSDPLKECYCGAGYTGENIEPFCKVHSIVPSCQVHVKFSAAVQRKCAPVYDAYRFNTPDINCATYFRCQSATDEIIKKEPAEPAAEGMACQYGTLTINIGDQLSVPSSVGFSKLCTKCICEVPPMLTCVHVADDTCLSRENINTHTPGVELH